MIRGGTPPGMPHTQRGAAQRPLTPDDVEGWLDAASKREPPLKRDRNTLREYLQARSRRRWRALQRELRWAERELLKLGMNPEDARWIV